jgi:hypothetical protein
MRCGQLRRAKEKLEKTLKLQPDNDEALTLDGLLCMANADDLLTTLLSTSADDHQLC